MSPTSTLTLNFQDVTAQRRFIARNVSRDATFGELRDRVVAEMGLRRNGESAPDGWSGLLQREGRRLHASEIVGDALQDGDQVELAPEVHAG